MIELFKNNVKWLSFKSIEHRSNENFLINLNKSELLISYLWILYCSEHKWTLLSNFEHKEITKYICYVPFSLEDPTESCFNETTLGGVGGKGKGDSWWSPSSATLGEATLATGEVGALGDEEGTGTETNRSLILA